MIPGPIERHVAAEPRQHRLLCRQDGAPGIYYFPHQGAPLEQGVIIFLPCRVEQIANDDAIGPSADAGKAAV
jgi:hypothetical protein